MFARSLPVAVLEIAIAAPDAKSVPPMNNACNVKFVLSKVGITESVLLA